MKGFKVFVYSRLSLDQLRDFFLVHSVAQGGGDLAQAPGHNGDPADEVDVEFSCVRRLWAGVVVKARREAVVGGAPMPAVGLPGIAGVAFPCPEVASLGFTEPVIVFAESGVDGSEELEGERAGQMGFADV